MGKNIDLLKEYGNSESIFEFLEAKRRITINKMKEYTTVEYNSEEEMYEVMEVSPDFEFVKAYADFHADINPKLEYLVYDSKGEIVYEGNMTEISWIRN